MLLHIEIIRIFVLSTYIRLAFGNTQTSLALLSLVAIFERRTPVFFSRSPVEMIVVRDKSRCNGCTACMSACPSQAIVMRRDREGFDYPVANPDRCVGCGKCESVCPPLNLFVAVTPLADDGFRSEFMKIAGLTLDRGGVVFGPVVNDDMSVGHVETEDMSVVEKMMECGYVQSDPYGTFEDAGMYLDEGREVLYAGAPCIIEGLNAFLGGGHEKLTVIACECRGVASPGLWAKCAETLKNGGHDCSRPYNALFEENMNMRPCCYGCNCRKGGNVETPKRREEFFKGVHSSRDLVGYMKGFVSTKTKLVWLFKK